MSAAPSYALLIPSRGRAKVLRKLFEREPELAVPTTFIGVEEQETSDYVNQLDSFMGPTGLTMISYGNENHSCGWAREQLRLMSVRKGFEFYVTGDDNMRVTAESIDRLVRCCAQWQTQGLSIVSGLSAFKKYFDRNRRKTDPSTLGGFRTFEGVGMILMCIPHAIYKQYRYPEDMYAGEDRHLVLSAMELGVEHFRICEDATFDKRRHQAGGQGSAARRQFNQGKGYARLASDFPYVMGQSYAARPMRWSTIHQIFKEATTRRLGALERARDFDKEVWRWTYRESE